MQNVTLPDKDELMATWIPEGALMVAASGTEREKLWSLFKRVVQLESWVHALYAKQGEDCPLFKEEE